MTDLKEWIDRNANRPLALVTGTVLCLQLGYLGYLAHNAYSAQLRAIDRVVETASLGIQQDNRPLIEATMLTGLRNVDAATVALCRGAAAELAYPPSALDPCRATTGGIFRWTVRRKAVGPGQHDFVFVINGWNTFAPLAVIFGITTILSVAILFIVIRARRRFAAEIRRNKYSIKPSLHIGTRGAPPKEPGAHSVDPSSGCGRRPLRFERPSRARHSIPFGGLGDRLERRSPMGEEARHAAERDQPPQRNRQQRSDPISDDRDRDGSSGERD
jgi:hypothetical protein